MSRKGVRLEPFQALGENTTGASGRERRSTHHDSPEECPIKLAFDFVLQNTTRALDENATGALDENTTGAFDENTTGTLDGNTTGTLGEGATGALGEDAIGALKKKRARVVSTFFLFDMDAFFIKMWSMKNDE